MIVKLKGNVDEIKPTEIIIDVNGVGYGLTIPLSTYEKIQTLKSVNLYVYTFHKEDQLKLYGFYTEDEKNLFTILINITGIGPSMAISILSGISIQGLVESVKTENPSLLVKIPGIGTNKSEKLIFELKRKIKKLEQFSVEIKKEFSLRNDAVDALVSLGFMELKSAKIIDGIIKENPDSPIEFIVKESLKRLSD